MSFIKRTASHSDTHQANIRGPINGKLSQTGKKSQEKKSWKVKWKCLQLNLSSLCSCPLPDRVQVPFTYTLLN